MKEKWKAYWWFCFHKISNKRKVFLLEQGVSSEQLYNIEETRYMVQNKGWMTAEEIELVKKSRAEKDWEKEYEKQKANNIEVVTMEDQEYPEKLRKLNGMPYGICMTGSLPQEEQLSIAVVGARNCSTYGEGMTLRFAEVLASAGIQIISGMARGIDGAAHRGALNEQGKTYAVLGCGVDICYPRENKGLYKDLQKHGGLISEYPPGTPPLASNFPARNRILSGLADIVLVMEAKEKSGSLITADMALEQGKDVYAMPGPVNSILSKGCHQLIRQGAGILISPEDLLEELHIQIERKETENSKKKWQKKKVLERKENLVYSCLDLFPRNKEEILRTTGLTPQELSGVLVSLELKGFIKEKSKNYYIRCK